MKLKTNNAAKKSVNANKNKSPNKQAKGVEVRKEKSKVLVKPTVLKKEAEKTKVESNPNPLKALQQELWNKALENVSNMTDLSEEESSIVKLLADYKRKSSIPRKSLKLKNFIIKGFSKYKNTSDNVLDGIYNKILNEFKVLGGNAENLIDSKERSKKADSNANKTKSKKKVSKEDEVDDEESGDDIDENEVDDEAEGIMFGDSDDDIEDNEDESEEEKPKPKAKGKKANNKNGKNQPSNGKNSSKFKGGKVQKNKKFGKKK